MRKPFRYVFYMLLGFILYQVIDSGNAGFTHQDARNTLAVAIIAVFILLLVVRVMKNRIDNNDSE